MYRYRFNLVAAWRDPPIAITRETWNGLPRRDKASDKSFGRFARICGKWQRVELAEPQAQPKRR
jgi:hypothetical protein